MAHSAHITFKNSVMSLDSAYDSVKHHKIIVNADMVPNIKENSRNRKGIKRGRKRFYSNAIYQERF